MFWWYLRVDGALVHSLSLLFMNMPQCIYSTVNEYLRGFQDFTNINNTAANIHMHVFWCICEVSLGTIPRSRITGP